MNYGFVNVAAAIPSVRVADVKYNMSEVTTLLFKAEAEGVEVVVFPELSLTGYSCQDLFAQQTLLVAAEEAMVQLLNDTQQLDVIGIVGAPVPYRNLLLNCGVVFQHGRILGIVPKTFLPNYNEFYEKRWFASSDDINTSVIHYAGNVNTITPDPQLFVTDSGVKFGVELCEDLWAPTPCSNTLALAGADIVFNLSASDELIGKHHYLLSLLSQQSARMLCGYVYSGCGFGESTQDVVYGGNALIYENGTCLARSKRFSLDAQLVVSSIDVERLRAERRKNTSFVMAQRGVEPRCFETDSVCSRTFKLNRTVDAHPFIPKAADMAESCEEIFNIQVAGLAKRLVHTHCQNVVVGISGGLDSTLALLVCVKTFDKLGYDRKGIVGVTMPGFGTTDRTYNNALTLMQSLGITIREISIRASVTQHFKDISHDINVHDVTYENGQARERTQILMDISNQVGGLVIGTGDLSELALGWATYNGDHMSMYGVNGSIPKTLIKYLVRFVADSGIDLQSHDTLYDILDTPISPELIPADENGNIKQKTEDLVGPYELHDFFLYYFLRFGFGPQKIFMLAQRAFADTYDDVTIKKWLRTFVWRFFTQQFKRSCLPDGPKVGSVTLSPRGDWRMPSDAVANVWLDECEKL
jgi:NAD+ synthase (glutamine-hydrolysing)